jgi:hypothetical protein
MSNFQACYALQYMIEPNTLSIVDKNRYLIKQGPIRKVAKRNGELLLRHLALVIDLIVFKYKLREFSNHTIEFCFI